MFRLLFVDAATAIIFSFLFGLEVLQDYERNSFRVFCVIDVIFLGVGIIYNLLALYSIYSAKKEWFP